MLAPKIEKTDARSALSPNPQVIMTPRVKKRSVVRNDSNKKT